MTKVTAAIIEKDGKILIARRRKGGRFEHTWEFPGGKIESGETPEECLQRELREELGINAHIGEFICTSVYDYGNFTIELLAYRAFHLSGDFVLTDHEEIKWVLPDELALYAFPEADIPIIREIQQRGTHRGTSGKK